MDLGWGTFPNSRPDEIAILAPDRAALTYSQVRAHLDATRERLCKLGIGRGDRVASVLPSGPDSATATIATVGVATFVPLDPHWTRGEYEALFFNLTPKIVLVHPGEPHPARDAARSLRIPVIDVHRHGEAGVFTLEGRTGAVPAMIREAAQEDIALILCASPGKLAPLTHRNVSAAIQSIVGALHLRGQDRCMNWSPLFEWRGLFEGLFAPLDAGGSVVCAPVFDGASVANGIERYRPTWFSAPPEISEEVPAGLRRGPRLYGMAEAPAIACDGLRLGEEISVIEGELAVRGPGVMPRYFRSEAATRDAFRDGWFRTGDSGHVDGNGRVRITGRCREFIRSGGVNVSPVEVDEALLAHPAVARAVTFPVPGPERGEDIAAAVVLRPGASVTAAALRRFAATHLSGYKVPAQIHFLDRIPKAGRFGMAESLGLRAPDICGVFPIQPAGTGVPLFVLAPPDSDSRNGAPLAGPGRPVFGIRQPDRERLPPPCTIEHIAAECVRRLRRFQPAGPYALGGWRADGIVALEMARQLEEHGEQVAFVAFLDTRDLFLPRMRRARRFLVRSWRFVQNLAFQASRWGAKPDPGPSENPAIKEGLRYYRPNPWGGRMVHIWAAERPKGRFRDPDFTWGHLAPGGFKFHEVPAEPFSMALAGILASELDRVALSLPE